jgi:hypothetical protein
MSEESRQQRNQVFSGDSASPPGVQTSQVMKEDFGFEVPVESVPLPSLGAVYSTDSPLHGQETVDIKAMTAREEDILTSRSLIKKGTVISHLIRSCMMDKSIDPDVMISGDRNAIMTAIRITGYGVEYGVEVVCPECGERSKQEFNLGELPIKRLGISPVSPGENLFQVELPVTKKTVIFKFSTGKDEQELSKIAERRKKSGLEADSLVTTRLSHQLVEVAGIDDKNKINHFVRNLPARDSLFLRKYMDEHEPGVEMKAWMDCSHCFETTEVQLPMGAGFFWPDS